MENRGNKSNDNKRFNTVNFNALNSPRNHSLSFLEIEWKNNDEFGLHTRSISAWDTFMPFNNDVIHYDIDLKGEWIGKTNTREINIQNKSFGILDNLTTAADPRIVDRWLLLFSFVDINTISEVPDELTDETTVEFLGFGLFHNPQARTTAAGVGTVSKGGTCTALLSTQVGYSFTTGAEVLVWNSTLNYNTGSITSIDSKGQIKIQLDTYSFGTTLTGAVVYDIIQTNMFRPYDINNKDTNIFENYQLLTGGLHIINDGGIVLQQFNYDSTHWSCKNFAWLTNQAITTTATNYPIFSFVPPTSYFAYVLSTIVSGGAVNKWINFRCLPSQSIEYIMDAFATAPHNSTWLHTNPFVVQLYSNTGTVNITLEITGYDEYI